MAAEGAFDQDSEDTSQARRGTCDWSSLDIMTSNTHRTLAHLPKISDLLDEKKSVLERPATLICMIPPPHSQMSQEFYGV